MVCTLPQSFLTVGATYLRAPPTVLEMLARQWLRPGPAWSLVRKRWPYCSVEEEKRGAGGVGWGGGDAEGGGEGEVRE